MHCGCLLFVAVTFYSHPKHWVSHHWVTVPREMQGSAGIDSWEPQATFSPTRRYLCTRFLCISAQRCLISYVLKSWPMALFPLVILQNIISISQNIKKRAFWCHLKEDNSGNTIETPRNLGRRCVYFRSICIIKQILTFLYSNVSHILSRIEWPSVVRVN